MYLGIDASLSRTGICLMHSNGAVARSTTIEPIKNMRGLDRLNDLEAKFVTTLSTFEYNSIKAVCIEGYAFGVRGGRLADLAEWGGLIRMALYQRDLPLLCAPPSTMKKFLHSGKLEKNQVLLQVYKKYGVDCPTDDQADAMVLADMARCWALQPKDITEREREAVQKCSILIPFPARVRERVRKK